MIKCPECKLECWIETGVKNTCAQCGTVFMFDGPPDRRYYLIYHDERKKRHEAVNVKVAIMEED